MPEHLSSKDMQEVGSEKNDRVEQRRKVWTMINPEVDRRVWNRRRNKYKYNDGRK